jgi:NarL family two-component system response regulator LiaR
MMNQSRIRILVVDDHEVLRKGLVLMLELFDDMECVGEASNGLEAIDVCKQTQPDIVLIDLLMPVMDGTTAIPRLRRLCPQAQIIVLTSGLDYTQVEQVQALKPAAMLYKTVTADTLVSTIRSVYQAAHSPLQEA